MFSMTMITTDPEQLADALEHVAGEVRASQTSGTLRDGDGDEADMAGEWSWRPEITTTTNAPTGEPVVILRARDKLMPVLLGVYREMCAMVDTPPDYILALDEVHMAALEWQATHPTEFPWGPAEDPETDHK